MAGKTFELRETLVWLLKWKSGSSGAVATQTKAGRLRRRLPHLACQEGKESERSEKIIGRV